MLSGILPRLNATIYCTITKQQGVQTSLHRNSVLSLFSLHSTSHCSSSHTKSMATSTSNAVLGDVYVDDLVSNCGGALDFTKPAGVYFKDRTLKSCLRASVNLRRAQPLCGPLLGRTTFDASWRIRNSSSLHGPWLKNFSTSSSVVCSAGAAHDVSFESSPPDEQLANSSISPHLTTVGGKALKLLSGSCYLPHPDKEETGGEDAHFICKDEQAIGVADGVGGWADVGVNAGLFAQELISNSVRAIQEEPKGSLNPARVLEKAH